VPSFIKTPVTTSAAYQNVGYNMQFINSDNDDSYNIPDGGGTLPVGGLCVNQLLANMHPQPSRGPLEIRLDLGTLYFKSILIETYVKLIEGQSWFLVVDGIRKLDLKTVTGVDASPHFTFETDDLFSASELLFNKKRRIELMFTQAEDTDLTPISWTGIDSDDMAGICLKNIRINSDYEFNKHARSE
jgi:hypothetical protein